MAGSGLGIFVLLAAAAIAAWLYSLSLGLAARKWNPAIWLAFGALALAGLLVPTSTIVARPDFPGFRSLENIALMGVCLLPTAALVMVALLLYSGLRLARARQTPLSPGAGLLAAAGRPGRLQAALALLLAAALLARTLYNLYWLLVWDGTEDGFDILWIALPVLAVVFSGLMLVGVLPNRLKMLGAAYTLPVLALLYLIFMSAKSVNYQALTGRRSEQIAQALARYHEDQGQYPEALGQLSPRYLAGVPGPVFIKGYDWCYSSDGETFRLGAITREHWSSPYYSVEIFWPRGEQQEPPGFCAEQIARYEQEHKIVSRK